VSAPESHGSVLPYATPASLPTRNSRYAFASLAVSMIAFAWFALLLMGAAPFNVYKQHRIGGVTAVFAIILAFAAYRSPNRRRSAAHVAMTAAGLALVAYVLLTPA
jgi:hypothetical protein